MLKFDRRVYSGERGGVKNPPPLARPYAEAGSVWQKYPVQFDLGALSQDPSFRVEAISLDGRLWVIHADVAGGDSALNFTLSDDGELIPVATWDFSDFNNDIGDVVQVGWDWVLTQKLFLSISAVTGDLVYSVMRPSIPVKMPNGTDMPSGVGITNGFTCDRETDWLFGYKRREDGNAPYWERLNEPLCGMQILHDFIIPRPDLGFYISDSPLVAEESWTKDALRYTVIEPQNYWDLHFKEAVFKETQPNSTFLACWTGHMGGPPNPDDVYEVQDYAVFVIDGELYVRSQNFFGSGLITFFTTDCEGKTQPPLGICCMADYNIWRKNYPDFDWDSSCLCKVGDALVLAECAEANYQAKDLSVMRFSMTGRYIPVLNKVAWDDDRRGENPDLIPPLKRFTGPEEKELKISFSSGATPLLNNACGYGDGIFSTFRLNEDASEDLTEKRSLKGANPHFVLGDSPVEAVFGRYIANRDKNKFFITDMIPPFTRRLFWGGDGRAALNKSEAVETDEEGSEVIKVTERLFVIGAGISHNGTGTMAGMKKLVMANHIVQEKNRMGYTDELFDQITCNPVQGREIRTVFGSDYCEDALPCWNLPIMVKSNDIGKPEYIKAYDRVQVGTNPDGTPIMQDKYRYEFDWIDPTTGNLIPTIEYPTDEFQPQSLRVSYIPETGEVRLCELMADTVIKEFSVPDPCVGWVGMTDAYYITERFALPSYKLSHVSDPWRHGESERLTALKYAPAFEMHNNMPCVSMYHVHDPSKPACAGQQHQIASNLYRIIMGFFNIPCWDLRLPYRYKMDDVHDQQYGNLLMDKTRISSGGLMFVDGLSHHAPNTYWGFDDGGNPQFYYLHGVSMAHYVKIDSLFRTPPHFYHDNGFTQEIPTWRYSKQVVVFKARSGRHDYQTVMSSIYDPIYSFQRTWNRHAFIMFELNVNVEKFNRLFGPTRLITPHLNNSGDHI